MFSIRQIITLSNKNTALIKNEISLLHWIFPLVFKSSLFLNKWAKEILKILLTSFLLKLVLSPPCFSQTFQNAVCNAIFLFPQHPYYLTQTVLCKSFWMQLTSSELILFSFLVFKLWIVPSFSKFSFLGLLATFFFLSLWLLKVFLAILSCRN